MVFVGASSSGKSTIAALLLRLYGLSQGSISMGNHAITGYNHASLRGNMALIDQDPSVFSGTLYLSIMDGWKSTAISEEEMREKCVQAAKAADAWGFIGISSGRLGYMVGGTCRHKTLRWTAATTLPCKSPYRRSIPLSLG